MEKRPSKTAAAPNPSLLKGGNSHRDFEDRQFLERFVHQEAAALTQLMDRYDRLVRYTILRCSRHRCLQDPQWLDTVAADTWMGFIRSIRRGPEAWPASVAGYLVLVARNQCVSALRATATQKATIGDDRVAIPDGLAASLEDPSELLSRLELLETLRECTCELDANDALPITQLSMIVDRKWTQAAAALGWSESTLRSRWKQILARLRRCVEAKTGRTFAPGESVGDF